MSDHHILVLTAMIRQISRNIDNCASIRPFFFVFFVGFACRSGRFVLAVNASGGWIKHSSFNFYFFSPRDGDI